MTNTAENGAEYGRLEDLPTLKHWFLKHAHMPSTARALDRSLWRLCFALTQSGAALVRSYIETMKDILIHENGVTILAQLEQELAEMQVNAHELTSDIAESAVQCDLGDDFFAIMHDAADLSHLIVYRFLAAWTALNMNELEQCIQECEQVDKPFAAINTIHGQALLESGLPHQAIEVLKIAAAINKNELLAWFQLGKAYMVINDHTRAWGALEECSRLAPQSEEVSLCMGMIALQSTNREWLLGARKRLQPFLSRYAGNEVMMTTLLQLGIRLGEKEFTDTVIATAQWPAMAQSPDFTRMLAPTLRSFATLGWQDLAVKFIDRVTNQAA